MAQCFSVSLHQPSPDPERLTTDRIYQEISRMNEDEVKTFKLLLIFQGQILLPAIRSLMFTAIP